MEDICKQWFKNNKVLYLILFLLCFLSETIFVGLIWVLSKFFATFQTNGRTFLFNISFDRSSLIFVIIFLLLLFLIAKLLFKHMDFKLSNEKCVRNKI